MSKAKSNASAAKPEPQVEVTGEAGAEDVVSNEPEQSVTADGGTEVAEMLADMEDRLSDLEAKHRELDKRVERDSGRLQRDAAAAPSSPVNLNLRSGNVRTDN